MSSLFPSRNHISDMRQVFCEGALVTACAVLWRRRNCIHHHHHHYHHHHHHHHLIIIIIIIISSSSSSSRCRKSKSILSGVSNSIFHCDCYYENDSTTNKHSLLSIY